MTASRTLLRGASTAFLAIVGLTACARVFVYPDAAPERDAVSCSDGQDNDFDDQIDCDDPDCVGLCSEEDAVACRDGLDNDGDSLTDAADPRCWLESAPVATRCAAAAGLDLVENFDAPAWGVYGSPWSRHGIIADENGIGLDLIENVPHSRVLADGRQDALLAFGPPVGERGSRETELGSVVRERAFAGSWREFSLSLGVSVAEGTLFRVGIVAVSDAKAREPPLADAEGGLRVTLDALHEPPALILDVGETSELGLLSGERCDGEVPCAEPMALLRVAVESEHVRAELVEANGRRVTVETEVPPSRSIPASKLVLWGQSSSERSFALVDDLRLHVEPDWPCGFRAPQIPEDRCGERAAASALGHGVAVTRSDPGDFCALVTSSETPSGPPNAVTAWTSADGESWTRAPGSGAPAIELPEGAALVGSGIAADRSGLHAVVSYRRDDAVELAYADAPSCAQFAPLEPGPPLFADAEAPSYVIAGARHDVYFTRPPTDETERTLWRIARGELMPELLATLPNDVEAPVSVSLAGRRDLVLAYPRAAGVAPPGAGLLVADATLHQWQRAGNGAVLALPGLLKSEEGHVAFDDRGLRSVALAWSADRRFLLYAGASNAGTGESELDSTLSVGTAELTLFGLEPASTASAPEGRCGNGSCETNEDCANCAADCPCGDQLLLDNPFDPALDWQLFSSQGRPAGTAYLSSAAPEFVFAGGPSTWSALPLSQAIQSDFELSFDVFPDAFDNLGNFTDNGHWLACSVYLGLGTFPPAGLVPGAGAADVVGVFARLTLSRRCANSYFIAPFVSTSETQYSETTPDDAGDCRDERYRTPGKWQHVVLRRRGGTLELLMPSDDGCGGVERTLSYAGALGELPALLIGFGGRSFEGCAYAAGTGTLRNLELRLLEDPNACSDPLERCSSPGAEPSCVDLAEDPEHCGSCAHACGANQVCRSGACVCGEQPGILECAGQCVDSRSSPEHCGGCEERCLESCHQGVCDLAFGDCRQPFAIPPEGGDFSIDLPREDPSAVFLTCDMIAGLPPEGANASVSHFFVATWTPAASGTAVVQLVTPRGGLGVLLGVTDAATGVECVRWSFCDLDLDVVRQGARQTIDVVAGATYRIGVGLATVTPEKVTLRVNFEP